MKLFEVTDNVNPEAEDYWEHAYASEADIKEEVFPVLKAKIDKLNQRASKLNLPLIQVKVIDEFFRDRKTEDGTVKEKFYKVKVEGDSPKLAGWEFVARVQHQGDENIIDIVPGEDVPEIKQFRATKGERCDHCKTSRFRVDTFIVKNDQGEYKQVGRNCLKDFLGLYKDPRAILWYMSVIKDLGQTIKDAEQEATERGVRGQTYFPVEDVLASTVAAVNKIGYIKRNDPQERTPTSGVVRWALLTLPSSKESAKDRELREIIRKPTPQDYQTAKNIVEWFKSLPEETVQGEQYFSNVNVMIKSGNVAEKNFGYIVGLYPTYMRAMDQIRQREGQAQKSNEWLGTVGQKISIPVTVVGTQVLEGQYGTVQLIRMEDERGNLVIWFKNGTPEQFDNNEKITISGTIKKHDEFRGRKQTVLTRAKIS